MCFKELAATASGSRIEAEAIQPCAAKCLAVALPIPELAPVIITVFVCFSLNTDIKKTSQGEVIAQLSPRHLLLHIYYPGCLFSFLRNSTSRLWHLTKPCSVRGPVACRVGDQVKLHDFDRQTVDQALAFLCDVEPTEQDATNEIEGLC